MSSPPTPDDDGVPPSKGASRGKRKAPRHAAPRRARRTSGKRAGTHSATRVPTTLDTRAVEPKASSPEPAASEALTPELEQPRTRRIRLAALATLPTPAIAGAAALIIAGGGAGIISLQGGEDMTSGSTVVAQTETGDDATDEPTVDPFADRNSPEVSRSISRETLQEQAEEQAEQREQALTELSDQGNTRGEELQKEAERRAAAEKAEEEESARVAAEGQWVLPVAGYTLTSTFGEAGPYWSSGYHTGLDFAAAEGTPLVAVSSGTVTSTEYDGAYGNKTVITLDDGTEIWYCHQSSFSVSSGQTVAPGETIGAVGSTGNVTGPHLHLEVHVDGEGVDPYDVLSEHGVTP